jgi:hypothetical protein
MNGDPTDLDMDDIMWALQPCASSTMIGRDDYRELAQQLLHALADLQRQHDQLLARYRRRLDERRGA